MPDINDVSKSGSNSTGNRNNEKNPEKSILVTVLDFFSTRAEIIGLEVNVAKDNSIRLLVFGLIAACCAFLALTFISVALLAIFWDSHRIFVACGISVFYIVLTFFFAGKAKSFASNLPYAFEVSKQTLREDSKKLRAAFEGKTAEATQSSETENKRTNGEQ